MLGASVSGWSSTTLSSNERTAKPLYSSLHLRLASVHVARRRLKPYASIHQRFAKLPIPRVSSSPSRRKRSGRRSLEARCRHDHFENSLHTQGHPAMEAWPGHAKDSIPSVLAKTCLTSPTFTTACCGWSVWCAGPMLVVMVRHRRIKVACFTSCWCCCLYLAQG